ncbi:BBE domain-containing protein [Halorussus salinisoli]
MGRPGAGRGVHRVDPRHVRSDDSPRERRRLRQLRPRGGRRPEAAYRENYDRSVEVKNKWDLENLFQLNHNVEPTK